MGDIRPILLALLGGAGLLLFIACVNVSSLLLVRSESRRREIAVRGALGASQARLGRQFFTEGLLLVIVGASAGLLLAKAAMQLLVGLIPKDLADFLPFLAGLGWNVRVLGFAAAVSLLAVILFSLTPIVRLSRVSAGVEMRSGLAEGSRGSAGTLWRRFGSDWWFWSWLIATVLLVPRACSGRASIDCCMWN